MAKHRHSGKVRYSRKGKTFFRKKPLHKAKVRGKTFDIYKSTRKNKEFMVDVGDKTVHFADPNMTEFPGTKRGDNYCARSSGIKGVNDINSPNFWSRKLWSCKGKKSLSKERFK